MGKENGGGLLQGFTLSMKRMLGGSNSSEMTRTRTSSTSSMSSAAAITPPQMKRDEQLPGKVTPAQQTNRIVEMKKKQNSNKKLIEFMERPKRTVQLKEDAMECDDNDDDENNAMIISMDEFINRFCLYLRNHYMNHASCVSDTASQFYSTLKIIPAIALPVYLKRMIVGINKGHKDSNEDFSSVGIRALIASTIYLDRLMKKSDFVLDELNVHRVIMVGMSMAVKFSEDETLGNRIMAKGGGMSVEELNTLESRYCNLLKFQFWIDGEEIESRLSEILNEKQREIPMN